ncbi:hypothetical protein ABZP36_031968 [Zizania latifolia]
MDPSDVEMEAAEAEPTPQPPHPPPQPASAGEGWSMLSRARALLEEGKPSLALQAVSYLSSLRLLHSASISLAVYASIPRLVLGMGNSLGSTLVLVYVHVDVVLKKGAGNGQNAYHELEYDLKQEYPDGPLPFILLAIRSQGGEQALMQTLNRARELYRQRSQPNPSVDDLASLLAQCAIAEAQSTGTAQAPGSDPVTMLDSDEACILAESGRKQIILDAFADGSSFICLKCGGLFSTSRKDEHLAYWCGTA